MKHPRFSPQTIIFPEPGEDARITSEQLKGHIAKHIATNGGWISFDQFMNEALYVPGLGYYASGSQKFGKSGDFVTAPEISPLFGQALAAQAAQVMALSKPHIIEVGAGSGCLAVDLLLRLEQKGQLPEIYQILELSGELRERQHATLKEAAPHLMPRINWLDRLPETFEGLVLGNEVLDAMPVHLVCWEEEDIFERGVVWQEGIFRWQDRVASGRLLTEAQRLQQMYGLSYGYQSEINLLASDWVSAWGNILKNGLLLLIDYGFPGHEYYYAERLTGTLMCHYRHHAHSDPFFMPGLQDITAHVDFTTVAEAGYNAGMDVLGYTAQGHFLINCGIMDILTEAYPFDERIEYLKQSQGVQKLILPTDMGEQFKVIALGKGINNMLIGFSQQDRVHRL